MQNIPTGNVAFCVPGWDCKSLLRAPEPSDNLKWQMPKKGKGGAKGGKETLSSYLFLPVSSQQLSGLLQVCVRTGTETQAKFTSAELLKEYISVRKE